MLDRTAIELARADHSITICERECRPVAQLAEHRSPKPGVGGSIPSWPASPFGDVRVGSRIDVERSERLMADNVETDEKRRGGRVRA